MNPLSSIPRLPGISCLPVFVTVFAVLAGFGMAAGENAPQTGEAIYRLQCAECHGARGEGVPGEAPEPLYGDRGVNELARIIHETMPEDAPETCVDEDAERVARYIHETFYSEEARARNRPARIDLARLTGTQYRQSVADLIASFEESAGVGEERGLRARYYNDRRPNRDKLSLERIDPEIRFDFGAASPLPGEIEEEAFAIQWDGALLVEESGTYEFCVRSENGFKLHLNSRGDHPLIDGWVSSGMMTEERASLTLLGGRAYPVRLETFKYKDQSASIELRWKPPGGVETVIPRSHWAPTRVSPVLAVQTPFPPDDSSMGYARGTAVSRAWHAATTAAALEVASVVAAELDDLAGLNKDERADPARRAEKVRQFAHDFVERAFRRPLTPDEKTFFVESRFQGEILLEDAVRRVVLLALESPRFLFPETAVKNRPHHTAAARLALALWDSLPDRELRLSADEGRLGDWEGVETVARRMLDHPLTRRKVRGFFNHWLHLDDELDLTKDPERYPGFDPSTIASFRKSLDLFIEDTVWGEDSDYRDLLLADHLYLNSRLGDFLGHSTLPGSETDYRKVRFDPRTRAGLLTHPFLLARFSYHQTTSPIHRGVFLTRQMLGRSLKPPPEAVQFEESRFDPHLTMREKVTELTKADSCMNCHSLINPLGFSLENFDAVGRYRFEERDRPIDPAGRFTTLEGEDILLSGPRDVARHAADSPSAQRSFIQHLFEHLIKQPVNAYGTGALDHLHDVFVASGFHIKDLIIEIVTLTALHKEPQHQGSHVQDKGT